MSERQMLKLLRIRHILSQKGHIPNQGKLWERKRQKVKHHGHDRELYGKDLGQQKEGEGVVYMELVCGT